MNFETEKLTTIRLSGQLGKKFGKLHRFYVRSPAEAVRAMCSQLEGFAAYLNDPDRQTRLKYSWLMHPSNLKRSYTTYQAAKKSA